MSSNTGWKVSTKPGLGDTIILASDEIGSEHCWVIGYTQLLNPSWNLNIFLDLVFTCIWILMSIFTKSAHQSRFQPSPQYPEKMYIKNAISLFFDAIGNKKISATIRIGHEIWCLPYAGFFTFSLKWCKYRGNLNILKVDHNQNSNLFNWQHGFKNSPS